MKKFLNQHGITEANFQNKSSKASEGSSEPRKRLKLGERRHRPVAEHPTETDEEGNPVVDSGATTRELSYHQANMEEKDPAIIAEEEESPEDVEKRRQNEFFQRFIGNEINPATGRRFSKEEKLLIYQKYQEINPGINDILDMDPNHVHGEIRDEIENLISSESDPDRKEFLEGTLDAFTEGGRPSYVFEGDHLRELFSVLCTNLGMYSEDIDDPNRKTRIGSIMELSADFSVGKTDVLGNVEDVIEKELERETNADRRKQLAELLDGLRDRVAIDSAERFARSQASRVASGHEAEFIDWMTKIVKAQGDRGTKEMRQKHQIGGMAVAYDTYAILNYLSGGTPESANPTDGEAEAPTGAEDKPLLTAGTPDFEAVYKRMKENRNRAIDWARIEAYSSYGREFHSYVIAQETIQGIEAVDESDRLVYENMRKKCLEWRAVLKKEKEPTEEQLSSYRSFVKAEMGKAFSKELERDFAALKDARNLATYDRLREEGRTIKRIMDAKGENLSPDDQAYYDQVHDQEARLSVIASMYPNIEIQNKEKEIEAARGSSGSSVDMGEDEGHPERFIARRRREINAIKARRKEIMAGAELTPEEMVEYQKSFDNFSFRDYELRASTRTSQIKRELSNPPLIGLHHRVDKIKASLPEGQTLDDLVARRESQHRYHLELSERYQAGKGRTEKETAEIRAYCDKVASPLKYFEYLRGVMEDRKKSHEMNVASKQRIIDIIERDQGSFSAAVFGDYSDRVATSRYERELKKNPVEYYDDPARLEENVARFGSLFPSASESEIRQKLISDQEKARDELRKHIESRAGDSEAYLFSRYGHNIEILGVDVEDHPGKLETLQRMADDLSAHIERLVSRADHVVYTPDSDDGANNLLEIIVEKATADSALHYLEEMIALVEQDAAEAADASRLQVASSTEGLAEAA